jgi:hypothetical protein
VRLTGFATQVKLGEIVLLGELHLKVLTLIPVYARSKAKTNKTKEMNLNLTISSASAMKTRKKNLDSDDKMVTDEKSQPNGTKFPS